jgi:hypothetical protein
MIRWQFFANLFTEEKTRGTLLNLHRGGHLATDTHEAIV